MTHLFSDMLPIFVREKTPYVKRLIPWTTLLSISSSSCFSLQIAELEISEPEAEVGPLQNEKDDDSEAAMPAQFDSGVDDSGTRKVSIIEQCLAWGGEQRLRLVLTLSVGGLPPFDNPALAITNALAHILSWHSVCIQPW